MMICHISKSLLTESPDKIAGLYFACNTSGVKVQFVQGALQEIRMENSKYFCPRIRDTL